MSKPLQVLIVEDSEGDTAMVVRLLRIADYDVHHERVENAAQIRAALGRQPWDVVIADYSLPQFDAPAALAVLQQADLDIPFIVVSGTIGEELAVEVMRAGAHDYVMKGNLARLVPAVKRELIHAGVRRERKQAEEILHASEAKYRQLHESMRDAFASVDMEGNILEWNGAYQQMVGYSDEELRRLTYADITPEGWHEMEARLIAEQVLPRGYSDIYEKECRRKNGAIFPVEVRTFLLRDRSGDPAGMWAIIRDITQRKQAELQLNEQLAELQRWYNAMLSRESRILDLKREVNALLGKAGQPPRYPSAASQGQKEK